MFLCVCLSKIYTKMVFRCNANTKYLLLIYLPIYVEKQLLLNLFELKFRQISLEQILLLKFITVANNTQILLMEQINHINDDGDLFIISLLSVE